MTWASNAVVGGFKAVGTFVQQSQQAKSDRAWQKYNNALTRIQNAQNQNNITTNEGLEEERLTRARFNTRVSGYTTQASAESAAAAVGAEGNSVDLVMLEIKRNEANAQAQLTRDHETSVMQMQEQRRSSNLQTEMQIDYTQIPKPSIAQALMQWGSESAGKWWESKKLK